ncbi:DUF2269 family protein [Kiloniella antarctica]|uniref:DUF2269 family protein n=1 Tax=Kiloniella antarctica TaxID=1550907 RepID=A0ABW5BLT3_9PROT
MEYLLLKWIHIISSTILFGTGIGSAFYMFMANRNKDLRVMYFTIRHVVIADWFFTTPSVIIQLLSGLCLVHLGGYDLTDTWIYWGLGLYFFAGICWLPVIWLQIKMRSIIKRCLEEGGELPQQYWRMNMYWIVLGSLAFPAIIFVFYLMVYKPSGLIDL